MKETDFENYGISVSENEDGSFQVTWDENDPLWMFLNDMTPDQISDWFNDAIKKELEKHKNKWTVEVESDIITGEYFLTIPPDAIKILDWKEGDVVEWEDNQDGSISLKKVKND